MNKKAAYTKVVAFYGLLHTLVTSKKFDEAVAESLMASFEEIREIISLEECTGESLKACHGQYNNPNADLDLMDKFSEAAFADLSPHLRNPRAQGVTERFRDSSGTGDDLYVHVKNVRLLGEDETGAAIVTLTVDSYSTLMDLLEQGADSSVEYTHCSLGKKMAQA